MRLVDPGRAAEDEEFFVHSGGLHDAARAGDVARQHGQSAVAEVGVLCVADAARRAVGVGLLVVGLLTPEFAAVMACRGAQRAAEGRVGGRGGEDVAGGDGFAERVPVDAVHRGVEQPGAVEFAEDGEDAPGAVDILDVVVGVGCDLAEHRHPPRKTVDVLHREIHARLVRHGQQVQHRVGRAAHGDVERHGVLEGGLGGYRARQDRIVAREVVAFGVADDERRGVLEEPAAVGVRGDDRAVAREREPQRFGEAVHRVGREHPRARSASGAGAAFDLRDLLVAARVVGAHDHRVDQVHAAAPELPGLHRASRDEDRRDVQPHGGHQHPGGDLVAVGDADQRIDLVGVGHVFDAVGDDLARGQRVEHAVVAHGDAVVHGDGVEFRGEASEGFDPLFDVLADFVQVHVARHELGERVGDADDRAAELLLAHAVGPPEASGSRHPAARRGDGASECVFHLSVSVSVCVPARAGNEKTFPRQEKGFIIFVDHARHLSPAIF